MGKRRTHKVAGASHTPLRVLRDNVRPGSTCSTNMFLVPSPCCGLTPLLQPTNTSDLLVDGHSDSHLGCDGHR